MYLYMYVCMSS